MWELIARDAARDAACRRDVLSAVDDLGVVHCQSWSYDNPAERLAERLSLGPGKRCVSILAGTSPQRLLNAAAERMLRRETEVALVVGGEALATVARLRRAGESPQWSFPDPDPTPFPIDLDEWHLPTEIAHGVLPAWLTFALFDQARAARLIAAGIDPRAERGEALAASSRVASANPYAWFRRERTAEEIVTARPDNRMIADPYTKLMTAFMDVDMAAGVLLATHAAADRLGVPPERRVYLRSWAFGRDATHVAARSHLDRSGAMKVVSQAVLGTIGAQVDDVEVFDLYSCFPSAIGFARDALGLRPNDARAVTVTGALPYHGGPSSNYMSHSIGHMVDVLRERPGALGLVSGVGMHMTKHVFAAYSTEPGPLRPPDYEALQLAIDVEQPHRPVVAEMDDIGRVAAATTIYDKGSQPSWSLVICERPDGSRAYARADAPEAIRALRGDDWIGRHVRLAAARNQVNVVTDIVT